MTKRNRLLCDLAHGCFLAFVLMLQFGSVLNVLTTNLGIDQGIYPVIEIAYALLCIAVVGAGILLSVVFFRVRSLLLLSGMSVVYAILRVSDQVWTFFGFVDIAYAFAVVAIVAVWFLVLRKRV